MQVEEALSACDQLIDDGKIRYASLAGMPAWQASRLQTTAEGRGGSPVAALGIDDGIAAELA